MISESAVITWPIVYKSPLVQTMIRACGEFGVLMKYEQLETGESLKHYDKIKPYKNVISWVCFAKTDEFWKSNYNFLFLENGLLDRGKSYYLDSNGYGILSNIVAKGYNKKEYSNDDIKKVYSYLETVGWFIPPKCDKDGPFLIGLQARNTEDKELLLKCQKYLPKDRKVIIRKHPASKTVPEYCIKFCENNPNWEMDSIDNVYQSVARSRALIVNNSSLMFKALFMGIPVAACKRWFHSGTSAVLDCSRNETLLKYILDYKFEFKASQNLICAIHEHSVSANTDSVDEILRNPNFANWIKRLKLS